MSAHQTASESNNQPTSNVTEPTVGVQWPLSDLERHRRARKLLEGIYERQLQKYLEQPGSITLDEKELVENDIATLKRALHSIAKQHTFDRSEEQLEALLGILPNTTEVFRPNEEVEVELHAVRKEHAEMWREYGRAIKEFEQKFPDGKLPRPPYDPNEAFEHFAIRAPNHCRTMRAKDSPHYDVRLVERVLGLVLLDVALEELAARPLRECVHVRRCGGYACVCA